MVVVALVWFGAIRPIFSAASRAEARAASAEQEVAAVRALSEEFEEVNGRLSAVEQRILRNRAVDDRRPFNDR